MNKSNNSLVVIVIIIFALISIQNHKDSERHYQIRDTNSAEQNKRFQDNLNSLPNGRGSLYTK